MSDREHLTLTLPPLTDDDSKYPSSDGKPMAETGIHVLAMLWLYQALEDFFKDPHYPFIATDMFWYFRDGKKTRRVAPDVMVCKVENRARRSYLQWNEHGVAPSIVFEMASKGTWHHDLGKKYKCYQRMGVREYVIFDPEALYIDPQLQMFRLDGSKYRRVSGDEQGVFQSELGFSFRVENTMLRLIDTATGHLILKKDEAVVAAQATADKALQLADEAQQSADEAQQKLHKAQQLADESRQKYIESQRRAEALQAELDRLRAKLGEASS